MNYDIRGALETVLDENVTKDSLENVYKVLKSILKDMNSKYTPLEAYELGVLTMFFNNLIKSAEKRSATREEAIEFYNWFKENALRKNEEKADLYGI